MTWLDVNFLHHIKDLPDCFRELFEFVETERKRTLTQEYSPAIRKRVPAGAPAELGLNESTDNIPASNILVRHYDIQPFTIS